MTLVNKVALVTGVTGTLGDRVASRLVEEGARVLGLIRKPEQAERLKAIGVEPVLGELTDKGSLEAALNGVHLVVHSAAYLGPDPLLARSANVDGVANIAEAALNAGVERFVHISTISVYGHPDEGTLDESAPLCEEHAHPYVLTKAESERILSAYAAKGLPTAVLRPGTICAEQNSHWGDGLIRRLAQATEINWYHPENTVGWIHTENLTDMVLLACTHPAALGQVYNAIDGNYPVSEFQLRICRALGREAVIPERPGSRAVYTCDKVRRELGYAPRRSFEVTVAALEEQARSYRAEP